MSGLEESNTIESRIEAAPVILRSEATKNLLSVGGLRNRQVLRRSVDMGRVGSAHHLLMTQRTVAPDMDRKPQPSTPPIQSNRALSGCGMRPATLPASLVTPAISWSDPFGFSR